MHDWFPARLHAKQPEAEGLTALTLDVAGTALAGSHGHAGQYVKLRLPDVGEALFALASAPSRESHHLELLVKGGAKLSDALLSLSLGATVEASLPQGRGFPLDRARGHDVVLVATGSGISPIRSAIEVIRADRAAFGDTRLYFGARTPRSFAYAAQLGRWAEDGIEVNQVVSQPGDSGWTGLTGYVQEHLTTASLRTIAFLCGQKAMVQAVTETLLRLGVAREHVFLNF